MDVDGDAKVALKALRRVWAPVSVVLTNAGLSGVRIDVHNDTLRNAGRRTRVGWDQLPGSADGRGQTRCYCTGPFFGDIFRFDLWAAFRDLSHSLNSVSQPPTPSKRLSIRRMSQMIRDALIVNPRPGQANSGICATASPSDDSNWRS